jgi:hypothetical protein
VRFTTFVVMQALMLASTFGHGAGFCMCFFPREMVACRWALFALQVVAGALVPGAMLARSQYLSRRSFLRLQAAA